MINKHTLCLLICLLFSLTGTNGFAQNMIGILDVDSIIEKLESKHAVDSLRNHFKVKSEETIKIGIKLFQENMEYAQLIAPEGPVERAQEIQNNLREEQDLLEGIETFYKNSIEQFNKNLTALLNKELEIHTGTLAKEKQLQLVINKKEVIYALPTLDITLPILEKILTETKIEKLLEKEMSDFRNALGKRLKKIELTINREHLMKN